MKKITQITAFLAALMLSTGAMAGPVSFGDDGEALQKVLDDITVAPDPGVSSVDVTTDEVGAVEGADEYWAIGGLGGSVATVIIEIANYAGSNSFGVFDMGNPANMVELFDGLAATASQALLSITDDGSVYVNFADTGVDFAGNAFGYYLDATIGNETPDAVFYSDTSLNADGFDHLAVYQGGRGDTIAIPGLGEGLWQAREYILAWEDQYLGGDRDFTDFVVGVESVNPVPAPGTLVLLGMALAGLGMSRRRKA